MKEMEVVNQKLKKAKNVATEALQTTENANKAKTDFLSNMSHDIRTPMNWKIKILKVLSAVHTHWKGCVRIFPLTVCMRLVMS